MIKSYLVDVKNGESYPVEIENTLEEFYRLLDCRCIDIVRRKIGRKYYDIICDDEGLFDSNPKISAIDNLGRVMLVGNLLITNTDEEGNTVSLTGRDISYIRKRVLLMYTRLHPEGYSILTQVEY